MEDLKQHYLDELKRLSNLEYRDKNKITELTENFNGMSIEISKKGKLLQLEQWAYLSTHPSKRLNSFCYDDDDEDYTLAVTPVLSTDEPGNSLSMGDEHLDTISATESDEVIKSSVEDLIPIPSESEGIPDHMCDVPFHDNSPPLDASPPDSELVSSEVMKIVIPEVGGIDDDILLTIKDDILREKLLNVNLLIAKIEALNDNPTPSFDCKTKSSSTSLNSLLDETNTFDNSLPEFEISSLMWKRSVVAVPLLILIFLFQNIKFSMMIMLKRSVVASPLLILILLFAPHYLLSLRNEDTIFDPGICISHLSRPDISHRCGTFPRFKFLPESPMEIFSSTCSPMDK
nr:hypothetical protein [Tanacetum cinerariifolium]